MSYESLLLDIHDINKGIIPESWRRYTVPGGLTVIQWITDFSLRVKQLQAIVQASQAASSRELKVSSFFYEWYLYKITWFDTTKDLQFKKRNLFALCNRSKTPDIDSSLFSCRTSMYGLVVSSSLRPTLQPLASLWRRPIVGLWRSCTLM